MATRNGIEIGQRFREAQRGYLGKPAPLWVVDEIVQTPADMVGYARLSCAADPSLRKTLSVAVLSDRRRFVLVGPLP